MASMKKKLVIGVTGMAGAGKATVTETVQKKGYSVVVMGDVVRKETKRRKLKPNPENLGLVMLKIREEEGPAVIAKRCIPTIERTKDEIVVVDGIRSLSEVKEFKRHFTKFALIAIHASPETRFHRLFQRERSDDPQCWETFMERDLRELSMNVGSAIATADYMIVNEGAKTELERKTRETLKQVLKKWMK